MQNLNIPEILPYFDPKTIKSTSTSIEEDKFLERKTSCDLGHLENEDPSARVGRWDYQEQILYLEFVDNNKPFLQSKECRRSSKIFKAMASFVKTRGPDQCRSHHQKMQKKYESIQSILLNCSKCLPRLKKRVLESKDLSMQSSFQTGNKSETHDQVSVEMGDNTEVQWKQNQIQFQLRCEKEPSEIEFLLHEDNNSVFGLFQNTFDLLL